MNIWLERNQQKERLVAYIIARYRYEQRKIARAEALQIVCRYLNERIDNVKPLDS
jgi:hypothetical protein